MTDLLRRNAAYAETQPGLGELAARPAGGLAVLTCMDCRIEPAEAFGVRLGEAHVLRNAGARLTDDVRRSLAVSVHLLGVREVVVVGHTACGMAAGTEAELRARIAASAGLAEEELDLELGAVPDVAEAVAADVDRLRADPLFAGCEVAGFVFDLASGRLQPA